jgi:hypothetical protein
MGNWKDTLFPYDRLDHMAYTEKKIRKFLEKNGVDETTINFAALGYIYFCQPKRERKFIAKKLGKTTEELDAFYDSVLQYCSQYKGFVELLK